MNNYKSSLAKNLEACWKDEKCSYHMPGHKHGRGAPPLGIELLGSQVYNADLSEMGGFDYLHAPSSYLKDAQAQAARFFGADQTYFLINGSTAGNIAAILAVAGDKDYILVGRQSHRSVFSGLELSGAVPIYLKPIYHPILQGYFSTDSNFDRSQIPTDANVKAVHVTRPNYYGFCHDLQPFASISNNLQIPLIVDEAHGAHFVLNNNHLPKSALSDGAHISIQSLHKTLGSLTQSSQLHVKGDLIDLRRLSISLQAIQSSSPSALLLLSIDLAISNLIARGDMLINQTVELAQTARECINRLPKLRCYGDEIVGSYGISSFDLTKLVINVKSLGITGFKAARWLAEKCMMNVELADLNHIVCSITIGDNQESISFLLSALTAMTEVEFEIRDSCSSNSLEIPEIPKMEFTPREASQLPVNEVLCREAVGEICAEYLIAYPPGIPIIVPGEVFSAEIFDYVEHLKESGCRIIGPSDLSLKKTLIISKSNRSN